MNDSKSSKPLRSIGNRLLMAAVILLTFLLLLPLGTHESWLNDIGTAAGVVTSAAAIWALIWEAPELIRIAREAVEAMRSRAETARDARKDNVANLLFEAYQGFASRHPEFAAGLSSSQLRALKEPQRESYLDYLRRAWAYFGVVYDAADRPGLESWRAAVWRETDLHAAAQAEWNSQLPKFGQS